MDSGNVKNAQKDSTVIMTLNLLLTTLCTNAHKVLKCASPMSQAPGMFHTTFWTLCNGIYISVFIF